MFVLNESNTVANHFLAEIRDANIQKDKMRFRRNMERLGEVMAYEISKNFDYETKLVETPLGNSSVELIKDSPILISIMRAALPYFQGFLNYFEQSSCGFIGAARIVEGNASEIQISSDYSALPSFEGKNIILIDPMLATGKSIVKIVQDILLQGSPKHIYITAVVASKQGLDYIRENLNTNSSIWTCAVDEHLNNKAYIVPGLGDAGDLAFGIKI